jgi:hypothetical protein
MKPIRTVYILGAGCSAGNPPEAPGYPLAKQFRRELQKYATELEGKPQCVKLHEAVTSTATELQRYDCETIDELVRLLVTRAHGSHAQCTPEEKRIADRTVQSSKIATSAYLLSRETAAAGACGKRYRAFLQTLFRNESSWDKAAATSTDSVLSFNYDRLFEQAWRDHFQVGVSPHPHAKAGLNSGLLTPLAQDHSIDPKRFSFLKLHGCCGTFVDPHWKPESPETSSIPGSDLRDSRRELTDSEFFPETEPLKSGKYPVEPLIVFPVEKPHTKPSSGAKLPHRLYVQNVWQEARRRVSEADRLWFIGYSFQPMDHDDVASLLRAAKPGSTVVIQDLPGSAEPLAQHVRRNLIEPCSLDVNLDPCGERF